MTKQVPLVISKNKTLLLVKVHKELALESRVLGSIVIFLMNLKKCLEVQPEKVNEVKEPNKPPPKVKISYSTSRLISWMQCRGARNL
jgi:hypothetical protein